MSEDEIEEDFVEDDDKEMQENELEGEEEGKMEDESEKVEKETFDNQEFYERNQLLSQLADHISPVFLTCGTYSSTVCVFLFPLIRGKNIGEDEDPETLFPILGMSTFHTSSVNQIATQGKYLLTGGYDEKMNHFDIVSNRHMGNFQTFEGGVTCMQCFGSQNHLLVGTENGMILLYQLLAKTGYQVIWKKECHKNAIVTSITVHPSNRCFVSICNHKKLCLVNLMTGKIQYETRLKNRSEMVLWWKFNSLLVIQGSRILCFRLSQRESEHDPNIEEEVMTNLFNYTHRFKISALEVMNEFSFITGDEKGRIQIWNYDGFNLDLTHEVENIHLGRVKQISCTEINIMEYLIVIVSDDGRISIWRLKQSEELLKLQFLNKYDVRFLSLGVNFMKNINQVVQKDYYNFRKQKLKERFEGEDDDEEEEPQQQEEEQKKEGEGMDVSED